MISDKDAEKRFISNPKIIENYGFLQEIGIFSFIDSLTRKIHSYKTLLTKGLNIFNHTSTSEIMDATVEQISYNFLPSYIAFLWKPVQNRPDITIRTYHNYKTIDMGLKIENITIFEDFFHDFPTPVNFDEMAKRLNNDEALEPFKAVQPEIVIPILGPFGLYGIILVGNKIPAGEYTIEELEFLHQLISFVSQAIKNHLHYEHSLRDVKTGLYNHGYFMVRLKEEVDLTKHSSYSSAVIVMDVDKFKDFNDSYGHLAGDQVLEKLAQAIRQNVRNNDIPSRFGGEEFTIMLPHSDISTAWAISERLRTCVAEMRVPWEVPLPQVTISLGVFAFDHNTKLEPTDILRRADEALYVSKARGRNRSTISEPGLLKATPAIVIRNF
ncbi:MAG: sensor domain-containing diguanylate cyclase [Treponema sp.]|jgi:diguanylate cyclase (GGDEF)-like protein|nr:sensor domain-containing diguanylate cyclase [Treponema sp.]